MAKTASAKGDMEATAVGTPSGRGPRSPNFPSISFADALAKARTLYDKDKRAASSLQTILGHLGFGKKLSGSAGRVISALRQFGLLEETGGQYRVTEAAVRIFTLSDGAPERVAAIQESAQKPAIYRELLSHYAEGLPSDAALKDFLILKKKFNPDSVDTFIRIFKATIEFAKLTPGAYTPSDREVVLDSPQPASPSDRFRTVDPPLTSKPPVGFVREVSSLDEGEAILQWPASLSSTSVEELEDWLALVLKKLKRRSSVVESK